MGAGWIAGGVFGTPGLGFDGRGVNVVAGSEVAGTLGLFRLPPGAGVASPG